MSDEDLNSTLRDAVSGVQPRRGLGEIEARLEDRHGQRRKLAGSAAAVAAIVLVTGGVAWANHHAQEPQPAPAANSTDLDVQAYFLGPTANGPRLFMERHHLQDVTASPAEAAVNAALGNPDDPDYRSGFPVGTTAKLVDDGDLVTIDFQDPKLAEAPKVSDQTASEAMQALVWTVNAATQRQVQVRFTIDGKPPATLLGKVLTGPISEQNADTVLSPVSLDTAEGAQLAEGSLVTGHAAAFEANVVWELRQGERIVKQGYATANECCTLSPFAFILKARPGSYTLVVHDTDASGGEGHGTTSDSKDILIQ
jgi:hypothetical protein